GSEAPSIPSSFSSQGSGASSPTSSLSTTQTSLLVQVSSSSILAHLFRMVLLCGTVKVEVEDQRKKHGIIEY
ncbi:hypothetical protein KI387_004359, partial [Taxus chinensis]